jgi:hypothetical protein
MLPAVSELRWPRTMARITPAPGWTTRLVAEGVRALTIRASGLATASRADVLDYLFACPSE